MDLLKKQNMKTRYRVFAAGIIFLQLLAIVACSKKNNLENEPDKNQEMISELKNEFPDTPVPDYYQIKELAVFDRDAEYKRDLLGIVTTDDQIIAAVHQISIDENDFMIENHSFLLLFFDLSCEIEKEIDISPIIGDDIETIQTVGISKSSKKTEDDFIYLVGKPSSFSAEHDQSSERGNLVIYYFDFQGELDMKTIVSASSQKEKQEYFYDSAILDREGNIYALGFNNKSGGENFLQVFSPEVEEIFTIRDERTGTKDWQFNNNYSPFLLNNSIYIFVDDISTGYGTRVSSVNLEKKELNSPVQMESFGIGGQGKIDYSRGGLLYADPTGIYFYNEKTKENDVILKWSEQDLSLSGVLENGIRAVKLENDQIFLSKMIYNGRTDTTDLFFYVLTKSENPNQKKDRLIIGGFNLTYDPVLQDAVMEFNQQSDIARIEILDYAENVKYSTDIGEYALLVEKSMDAMNLDILTGNIPDMLYGSAEFGSLYSRKEILADLNGLMIDDPEFQKIDLYSNVLELGTYNEKLTQIYTCFHISALVGLKSIIGERTTWTIGDFLDAINDYEKGKQLFGNISQSNLLISLLYVYNQSLFDIGNKTADFSSEEFKNILSLAKKYGLSDQEMKNSVLMSDELVLYEMKMDSQKAYIAMLPWNEKDMTIIGYPDPNESCIAVNTDKSISIFEDSSNKETAWEFIKILLSVKYQKKYVESDSSGFPIRISTNEELIDDAMQEDESIRRPLNEDEAELFRELFNRKLTTAFLNKTIKNIVVGEAQAFFAEQKTLEQTVETIQNRVQTYINEQA